MKSAYVVSDENGYYDSQNIINVYDKILGKQVLSCILHHSRNHEGGKGRDPSSISSWFINRWVLVVEFHDPTLGIGKVFGQESTVVKLPDFESPSSDSSSKSANFGLSKWIFCVKNHPNLSKKNFHWRISI